MPKQSIEKTSFHIRNLRRGDITSLSGILASSFYLEPSQVGGFAALIRWLYPLLCWGISADLFSRLTEGKSRQVCLVATYQAGINQSQAHSQNQRQNLFQSLNSNLSKSKIWLPNPFAYPGLSIGSLSDFDDQGFAPPQNGEIAIATVEVGLQQIPPIHSKLSWFKRQKQFPYISNLAVHPQWRRKGMAQNLLSAAEQTARRWGYCQIFLHVLESNFPARSLYHQLGYELYKIEPDLGVWLWSNPRRLLMRKQLR